MPSLESPPASSQTGPFEGQSDPDDHLPSVVYDGFNLGEESQAPSAAVLGLREPAAWEDDSLARLLRVSQWQGSEQVAQEWGESRRTLPRAGDEVMGFRLVRELGRGAFGRVFLAEQMELAGRRVAVKITRAGRDESQTLAQLQHSHIVPIYSVHLDPASGLRMLVMPYFGGTTLTRLLQKAGLRRDPRATGHSLVTALDELTPAEPVHPGEGSLGGQSVPNSLGSLLAHPPSLAASQASSPWLPSRMLGRKFLRTWGASATERPLVGQPSRHLLEKSSYVHAVTWIAARLAEALAHAHGRGILHRDIKPSNVLIASDGQPMLLDFNLARDLKTTDCGAAAYLGGTLPYMAPEHLDAFNVQNPTPPTAVDERSDIYSLGVVFFEMLAGKHPFEAQEPDNPLPELLYRMAGERRNGAPSPRAANPVVPRSLDAVVRRCLEPDPARRYQVAAELAEDLQRELDHLPLQYTREPSLRERARKWMRRHPRWATATPLAAISAAVLVGLLGVVLLVGGRLAGYDTERRSLQFQQGLVRAQCLVHTGIDAGQNLADAEKVCENALCLFSVLKDDHWTEHPRVARLSEAQQAKVLDAAAELLLLFARVRVRQADLTNSAQASTALLKDAVQMLDRAERLQTSGVPRALYEDRSNCRRLLGDAEGAAADWQRAQAMPVRTARDHYLLATSLAVEKRYAEAVDQLEAALQIDQKHFWSHFELGICLDQLGRADEAARVYGTAIALWPDMPWTYLNRGLARSRQGQWAAATEDYSQAIRLDPAFADAYVNRGLALLNQHRYSTAIDDLNQALKLGRHHATVWSARAAAHAGLGDFDRARSDYESALQERPGDESILLSRGFALARHDPAQALADFDHVLARNPQSARAHYGRAFVLSELPGRDLEAIEAAEQALAADPKLVVSRCVLALLHARRGEYDRGITEAEDALRQANSGPVCYAAACTYALASRSKSEHAERALDLLAQALAQGYGQDQLQSDPDLGPIRKHQRFAEMSGITR